MRRWMLWAGGVALLGIAVLFVLVLLAGPPTPPFKFLEGRSPSRLPDGIMRELSMHDVQLVMYTFKADYAQVARESTKELKASGFNAHTGGSKMTFEKDEHSPIPSDWKGIHVRKDKRYLNGSRKIDDAPGWVTVECFGERKPGFFDQVRAWLGL